MNRHLVTVKVGVECRANEWVQLDGFAFNQDRLKRLDTQAVQSRRTVEHDGVLFDDLFQDVPHHRRAGFDFLLCRFDSGCNPHGFQARKDEGLEQFQGHQFRQSALVQLEGGAHGNHGTTGVVDAFAQQVLAETTALAFDHVCQGFQCAFVRTCHGFATATVVKQGVHRLLQHALFIAGNDFRRFEFKQTAQTAVAVDHAAVQIIQVRGRETTAVQRHQGTQVRRQHRQHFQDHPLGLDARLLERFKHFEALGVFLDLELRASQVIAQLFNRSFDVNAVEQIFDAFSTHLGLKLVAILFEFCIKVVFGHDAEFLQRRHAGIGHHIGFKVQDAFDITQRHIQHQT